MSERMTRYGIGTSEIGVVETFDNLQQATPAAQEWARSEQGAVVAVYVLGDAGEVLDTVATYGD